MKLAFTKSYIGYPWDDGFRAATHRAIKTRRQAIRRRLRHEISEADRKRLIEELQDLDLAETQFFGVKHRDAALPLNRDGKPYIPKTARGTFHVPVAALPLNARNKRHVPSPRDIVANAVFEKFAKKGSLPMALAKLASIHPEKYRADVLKEAKIYPEVQRALNRVGSDVLTDWPPKPDEMIVLENFYATKLFRRPLMGVAPDVAVFIIAQTAAMEVTPDRYRRILKNFLLSD